MNVSRFLLNNRVYYGILTAFCVFLAIFRLHNALSFNPYWGYDGGGHVGYILSIAKDNRIPSVESNYIAWHEPLYYYLQGFFVKGVMLFSGSEKMWLKSMSVFQFLLSMGVMALSYFFIHRFLKDRFVVLLSFMSFNLLPSLVLISAFVTNELLNYFFILLAFYVFYRFFIESDPRPRHFVFLAIVIALGLLTKITMLIVLVGISMYLVWGWGVQGKKGYAKGILILITIISVLYAPWYWYRSEHVLGQLSINNFEFQKPVPLRLDSRLKFYSFINWDIFQFPYWYSGGDSFWTIVYADSLYDYYGYLENQDYILAHKEDRIRTTHNETYVSKDKFAYAQMLPWLSLVWVLLFIPALLTILFEITKKHDISATMALIFVAGFFAALLYYGYRYPYYGNGVVKAAFIYPAYVFMLMYGFRGIQKWYKWGMWIVLLWIMVYFYSLVGQTWVMSYHY